MLFFWLLQICIFQYLARFYKPRFMSQRYRLFPLLYTENTSKNVNLWGFLIVFDSSPYPTHSSPLKEHRRGFSNKYEEH